jgi:hypothetical protein
MTPPTRQWKTEVVVASLEMLSGHSKKEYAREASSVAEAPQEGTAAAIATNGAADETLEAVVLRPGR